MYFKARQWALFSVFILFSALSCRLERREDFDFSTDHPLRCGVFKSYYFVREVKEEVYPDLGLVVANRKRLALDESQHSSLQSSARACTELCEVKKDALRVMQEAIKAKLALNEIKGDLRLLAKEVREFEAAKAEWLAEHAARYHKGMEILSEGQRAQWVVAERFLKPLPPHKN